MGCKVWFCLRASPLGSSIWRLSSGPGRHQAAAVSCFPSSVRLLIPLPLSRLRTCQEEGGRMKEFNLCERRWTLAGKKCIGTGGWPLKYGCDRLDDCTSRPLENANMRLSRSVKSLCPVFLYSFFPGWDNGRDWRARVHTHPGPKGLSPVGAESPCCGISDLLAGGHFYFSMKRFVLECTHKMAAKQVPPNEVVDLFVF